MSYQNRGMPWGRSNNAQQINPQIFPGQLSGMGQQIFSPAMNIGTNMGMSLGSGSLPLNTAAFGQQSSGMGHQAMPRTTMGSSAAQQPKQRAFIGTVTKMQENYGFIDDDVFFQHAVVKGPIPRISDKVMVEATYNSNMPFKWNASRIQVLPNQTKDVSNHRSGPTGDRSMEYGSSGGGQGGARSDRYSSTGGGDRRRSPAKRRRSRSPAAIPAAKRRDDRDRDSRGHSKASKRDRSQTRHSERHTSRYRSRSPEKDRSPRRRNRATPRYAVAVPRGVLNVKILGAPEIHRRYENMYIPSDYFLANFQWQSIFPLERPFSFIHEATYYVMHRDVDPLSLTETESPALLDPPDMDYRYSAKVMLLGAPSREVLFKKCLCVNDEGFVDLNSADYEPHSLSRTLSFLVGCKSKSENMAIGGPWSKSLDGEDPANDPRVLIKTAIRTTKALTGIDLSRCTRWYKFLEVHYRRVEKEKVVTSVTINGASDGGAPDAEAVVEDAEDSTVPTSLANLDPRLETVVIFIPDVWNVVPSQEDFELLQTALAAQMEAKLTALDKETEQAIADLMAPKPEEPKQDAAEEPGTQGVDGESAPAAGDASVEAEKEDEDSGEANATPGEKPLPTSWSKLDIKTMKVAELRSELDARGIESKGIKTQLVQRLQKALKSEEEAESAPKPESEGDAKTESKDSEETPPEKTEEELKAEEEAKQKEILRKEQEKKKEEERARRKAEQEEKDRLRKKERMEKDLKDKKERLTRHFKLEATAPGVMVYPNKTAKSGKFDCKTLALKSLLDYRLDDAKEHSFEVALFAEAFQEMMLRDAAFAIYKTLLSVPPPLPKPKTSQEKNDKGDSPTKDEGADKMDSSESKNDSNEIEVLDSTEAADTEADQAVKAEQAKENQTKTENNASQGSADLKKTDTDAGENDDKTGKIEKGKDESGDEKAKEEEKPKEKTTCFVIENPDLLLSFTQYDVNHTSHLMERDLDDIVNYIGLQLSRSQVQKIVRNALASRSQFQYRKYTDAMRYKDGSVEDCGEATKALSLPSDEELARGNLAFVEDLETDGQKMEAKNEGRVTRRSAGAGAAGPVDVTGSPAVVFQGSLVDVAAVMEQLGRMEREQKTVQHQNSIYSKQIASFKDQVESLDRKRRRAEEELKDNKKALYDTQKELKSAQVETTDLKTGLKRTKESAENIIRVVDRAIPPPLPPKKVENEDEAVVGDASDKKKKDDGKELSKPEQEGEEQVVDLAEGEDEAVVTDEVLENDKPEADMETN